MLKLVRAVYATYLLILLPLSLDGFFLPFCVILLKLSSPLYFLLSFLCFAEKRKVTGDERWMLMWVVIRINCVFVWPPLILSAVRAMVDLSFSFGLSQNYLLFFIVATVLCLSYWLSILRARSSEARLWVIDAMKLRFRREDSPERWGLICSAVCWTWGNGSRSRSPTSSLAFGFLGNQCRNAASPQCHSREPAVPPISWRRLTFLFLSTVTASFVSFVSTLPIALCLA